MTYSFVPTTKQNTRHSMKSRRQYKDWSKKAQAGTFSMRLQLRPQLKMEVDNTGVCICFKHLPEQAIEVRRCGKKVKETIVRNRTQPGATCCPNPLRQYSPNKSTSPRKRARQGVVNTLNKFLSQNRQISNDENYPSVSAQATMGTTSHRI